MITDKKIKAIVFDYGMVLLEWDPRRIFQRAFPAGPQAVEAFLDEIRFMEWHKQQDNGRSFAEAIAERSAQFPQYAHILPVYDSAWSESVVGPIDGTVKILRRLKQAGYPLYGLSNYPAEKFRLDRARFEFFDWFDDMVISGEVRLSKPDPAIFHLLLGKIGRPAGECVFIDDSPANIAAAQKLGFAAIQFHSPEALGTELRALGLLP
jgi:2-haloacid dehalogenase